MTVLYSHPSGAENANGSSGPFSVPPTYRTRNRLTEALAFIPWAAQPVALDANVTVMAGTTPSVQFVLETSWDGGQSWSTVKDTGAILATGALATAVVGQGIQALGGIMRLRWILSVGATITFTASVRTL